MKLLLAASMLLSLSRAQEEPQCSVYLAPSSTSTTEEPKWGIYAGTEIQKGEQVGIPEIAIQTLNIKGSHRSPDDSVSLAESTVEFFEQFIWVPDATAGKYDVSAGRLVAAVTGAGVLGAFNIKLTNAEWNHLSAHERPSMNESPGVAHVGRGAYTNFYNVALRSKDTILAGTEIFLDYGENWEDDEEEENQLQKSDYAKMDIFVQQMIDFMDKYKGELDESQKTEIFDFLVKDILSAAAGVKKGRLMASLLPTNPDDLSDIKEAGGSLIYSVPSAKRSMEWLRMNGRCMDNLKVGPSTIEYAGRGAFSQRALRKGTVVIPVPLVHLPDKSAMDMYEVKLVRSSNKDKEGVWQRSSEEPYGKQLLLNYCYGHPESNMLFFAAGSVSGFINHSPTPNVKMVWSDHSSHEKDWFELDPETLIDDDQFHLGLMMDIIAIRDIEEGEEVFLDYGSEWQAAWDKHVVAWKKGLEDGDIPDPWPIRALDMNDEFKAKGYKTKDELETEPYPENVRQMCFLVLQNIPDTEPKVKTWAMPTKGGTTFDADNLFDCAVVERIAVDTPVFNGLGFNYTIEYKEEKEFTLVHNVPHVAITFVDKPDTGDQWVTKNAFRHHIGIPDEIFPQGPWRDASVTKK